MERSRAFTRQVLRNKPNQFREILRLPRREEAVPCLEDFGFVEVEPAVDVIRELEWGHRRGGDEVAIGHRGLVLVQRTAAISRCRDIFARVAGVAPLVEETSAREP